MLLPGLHTQPDYVNHAKQAGLNVFSKPFDISDEVSKTWYVVRASWIVCTAVHDHTVLTYAGIYHGPWFRIPRFGHLPSPRAGMA